MTKKEEIPLDKNIEEEEKKGISQEIENECVKKEK